MPGITSPGSGYKVASETAMLLNSISRPINKEPPPRSILKWDVENYCWPNANNVLMNKNISARRARKQINSRFSEHEHELRICRGLFCGGKTGKQNVHWLDRKNTAFVKY